MARPREFDTTEALRQAMLLFWKKGYEATSMTDLLEATDLSKSSLYQAFADKRSLFLAALDTYRRDRAERLRSMLTSGECGRDAVQAFFRKITRHVASDHRHYGCMSCNEAVELGPHDEEVQRIVAADFQSIEDAFAAAIRRGQADGSIASGESPRRLARFLTAGLQGLQVLARAKAGRATLADTVSVMLSVLDAK